MGSGQTILVSSTYDKKKDKLKFSTGLDVYRNQITNNSANFVEQGDNYYSGANKLSSEAEFYLKTYSNDFKFCALHTKSFIELLEFKNELKNTNNKIEGKVN